MAPDGSWLASGGDDGTVRIWDAATGQQRAVLTGQSGVEAIAVAPDSSWLASGSHDGTVRIWDAVTWHTQAIMRTDSIGINCDWLSPDALIISGSAGTYLFDLLTETTSPAAMASLRLLPHPAPGNDVYP